MMIFLTAQSINYSLDSIKMMLAFCLTAILLQSQPARAEPQGALVVSGQVNIKQQGNLTKIKQKSQNGIIDWQSFDIAPNEQVRFQQPNSNALILNRITNNQPSALLGQLTANGRIMLVNPAGVFFGPNSMVDVAALLATTATISNEDFLAGDYSFIQEKSNANAAIINEGQLKASEAGLIALVAPQVINRGVIEAHLGKVILASGGHFTVDMYGDGLIQFAVADEEFAGLINQSGQLSADGGTILLTTNSAKNILDSTINMDGIIQANTVLEQNGEIILQGSEENSLVTISGELSASGREEEKGGKVTVLGNKIAVLESARLNVSGGVAGGEVLIGGDYLGQGELPQAKAVYFNGEILANAIEQGNGGKVILWSDELTQVYGDIEAKGGRQWGSGGFIETSSKNFLEVIGASVEATASNGQSGQWLLDPSNVNITSTTINIDQSGVDPLLFSPNSDSATVDVASINSSLNAGTSVTVDTNNGAGVEAGNITVSSAISKTGGGEATLLLTAANDIIVNNTITSSSGELNVTLTADDDASSAGDISINATIDTNGGDFTGTATAISLSDNAIDSGSGNVTLVAASTISESITTSSANITSTGTVDLTAANSIGALGSALDIANASDIILDVNDDLFINGSGQSLSNLDLTLDPNGAATYELSNFSGQTFNVSTDGTDLTLTNVSNSGVVPITITADSGNINVTNFDTNESDLILSASAGNISLSADAINAGSTSGTVHLAAAGAITDTAGGTSLTTNILTLENTTGATNLTNSSNNIGSLGSISASGQAVSINNGSNAHSFSAGANVTADSVTLTASDIDNLDNIASLAADMILVPLNTSDTIGLAVSDSSNFTLTTADIAALKAGSGSVTIGNTNQTGALTLGADLDLAGKDVTIASGQINEASNSLLADSLTLDINSGSSANTIKTTVSSLSVDTSDSSDATGRTLNVVESNGVVIAGIDLNDGDLTFTASGAVSQSGGITAEDFTWTNSGGATTLDSNNNLSNVLAINSSGQAVEINNSSNALNFSSGAIIDASSLTLTASDIDNLANIAGSLSADITLRSTNSSDTINLAVADSSNFTLTTADIAELKAGSGSITIGNTNQTGTLTLGADLDLAGKDVTIGSGQINEGSNSLIADSLSLDINSGSSANTIKTTVNSLSINTTDSSDATGRSITVTESGSLELDNVNLSSGSLNLTTNGALTDSAAIDIAGTTTLSVGASNDITLDNGSNDFGTLVINDADDVILVDSDGLDLGLMNLSATLDLTASGAVTQSAALTTTALTLTNSGGATNLTNSSNNIAVLNSISASGQAVSINNGSNAHSFSAGANVTADSVTLTASDIDNLDNIASLAADMILVPLNTSDTIGLAVSDSSNFTLTTADIAALKAGSGSVTIGNTNQTGALTLGADLDLAGKDVTIASGQINEASNSLIADSLTLDINSGSSANTIKTTVSSLSVDTSDSSDATGRTLNVVESNGVVIAGIDLNDGDLTFTASGAVSQSGGITAEDFTWTNSGGATTLDSNNNLSNLVAINSSGQAVEINNSSNALNFSSGAIVDASSLTLTASDIDNLDNIASLAADMILVPLNTSDTIGLAVSDSSNFTLTTADIAALKAGSGSVTIGNTNQTGALTLGADLDLAGKDVTIASGQINEASNSLIADSLTLDINSGSSANTIKTNITSLSVDTTDGADITGRSISVTENDAVDLVAVNTAGGAFNLSGNGEISESNALIFTGTTTLSAGSSNNITLDNVANDFDTVIITSANDVILVDSDDLDLGASTVSGTLEVTTAGALTQSGALTVNELTLSNTSAATTLTNSNNNITNLASINATGQAVAIHNGSNAHSFSSGATIAADSLTLTASDIDNLDNISSLSADIILQTENTSDVINLAVTDSSAFSLTTADIAALKAGSGSVTIGNTNQTGALTLGADVDLAGKTVTLNSGQINEGSNSLIADSLSLDINSGSSANTVKTTVNSLSINTTDSSDATGRRITVTQSDAIDLVAVNTNGGNFELSSNGAISQSNALILTGTATIAAGAGNNIILDESANDFSTVIITSANDVTLVDMDDLDLGASTVSGTLEVTTAGALTQSGALTVNELTLSNTSAATTLTNSNNNITNLASINATGQAVAIHNGSNAHSFSSGATIAADSLTLTASDIDNLDNISSLSADIILQTENTSDVINLAVTDSSAFSLTTADIAALKAGSGSVTIGNTNQTGALTLGADVDLAGKTVTLNSGQINEGSDSLIADSLSLDINSGSSANTVRTTVNSLSINTTDSSDATGQSLSVTETDGLIIAAADTSLGTLSLTASGAVTQTGAIVTGELALSNTSAATTLTNSSNNITSLASINATGQAVAIHNGSNAHSFSSGATIAADSLTLTASDIDNLDNISSLAADIILQTENTSDVINLAVTDSSAFSLTTADIAALKAGSGTVTIGNTNQTGALTLGADLDLAGKTVTLNSGQINEGSNSLIADSLSLDINSGSSANTVKTTVNSLSINTTDSSDATGQSLSVTETEGLIIAAADTSSGTLSLTASGAITQTGAIVTGELALSNTSAATTLTNSSNNITNLASINATGQAVAIHNGSNAHSFSSGATIAADSLTLTASDIDNLDNIASLSADIILQTENTSDAINLAVTDSSAFSLTTADIAALKAGSGNVTLGNTNQTGALTLGADVDLAGKTVTLNSGQINEGSNSLIADSLSLDINSGSSANTVKTTVNSLSINTTDSSDATGQSLSVTETDGLIIAAADTSLGTLSLTASGAVTQTGAIVTGELALSNTSAATTLTNSSNNITSLASINATGQAVAIHNGSNAHSFSSGATIAADSLTLTASDIDNLDNISSLAADIILQTENTSDVINLAVTDSSAFSLTTADIAALKAGSGTVTIGNSNQTGALTLGADLDLAGKTVTLNSGEINESINAVFANQLKLATAGGITLDAATNDVDTLAIVTSSSGNVNFHDADDLTIGSVEGANGVEVSAGNLVITAIDQLSLEQDISTTNRDITLNGPISGSGELNLSAGTGDITFSDAAVLTELSILSANNFSAELQLERLVLNSSSATITGLINQLAGELGAKQITVLNEINPGTHFFNSIDLALYNATVTTGEITERAQLVFEPPTVFGFTPISHDYMKLMLLNSFLYDEEDEEEKENTKEKNNFD